MSWIFDEEVLAVIAAIVIVGMVFGITQFLNEGRVVEPFSAIGLLGPEGKIGGYPKEVVAGSPFLLNVYIGNNEGKTMYYRVLVKIGDNTSLINESTPLNVSPIMEIRYILTHNMSKVIPINITLFSPSLNMRLVFELWIYNESLGRFMYYGRWNQLWLNVTKSQIDVQSPEEAKLYPAELEERLVDVYLSIRRAEEAGGNVSEMVRLTNLALDKINRGEAENIDEILDSVLLLEDSVVREGLESSRLKWYLTIGSLSTLSGVVVGIAIYLKRNIWLLWARIHKDWIVKFDRKSGLIHRFKNKGEKVSKRLKVLDLVYGEAKLSKDPKLASKLLYDMVKEGNVELIDPNPPTSFSTYFLSRYNISFIAVIAILSLGVISIYLTEEASPVNMLNFISVKNDIFAQSLYVSLRFVRSVIGSILILFIPGYSLIEALYPDRDDLTPLERLALSIGLSLAIVPLVGLILNYTPWGIRLNPLIVSLSLLVTTLLLIASYRKFDILKLRVMAENAMLNKV